MTDCLVALVTAPNEAEAESIARALVEDRLAACVNMVRGIRSLYRWEGAVQDDSEVLMVVKTRQRHLEHLVARVKELHSYTVPEIIALPIVGGSADYLAWLADVTQ